jgi:para-aminobenzoate synthetase component 1
MELPPLHRVDMPARFIFYRDYYICTAPGHWLLITAAVGETGRRISDEMRDQLEAAATERIGPAANARLLSTPNGQDYVSAVRRVLDYIAAGDIYQMNLTRRWMGSTDDPLAFWRQMCEANPGRYSAYLQTGNQAICCTSPELFLARDGRTLVTCPIKGTRRRHRQDSNLDRREADALLSSEKELAELTMITDLLRNDLGRVCGIGSVRIAERRKLEALPSVWQTYAVIHGSTGLNWGAILAGMLPGGSITGVPKKRAMEIIDELEPCERGVYCGNIGWIGPGKGCLNIAIRTAIWESGTFHYAAGAGIVADSDPEAEFAEIAAKACAVTELCRG